MATFDINEISEMSGLSIGQIEQAIHRGQLLLQGEGGRGHARQFSEVDAFHFCLIGELRRFGVDWKSIVGSTAFPWPIAEDLFEIRKMGPLLLTPMVSRRGEDAPKMLDINPVKSKQIMRELRDSGAVAGVVIDASEIVTRIEIFARRRKKLTRDSQVRIQQRRPKVDTYSAQER
jgi:ribosome-associated protein YbcJ (S4-like RNA binding protein)